MWPTLARGAASPRTEVTLSSTAHISWPYKVVLGKQRGKGVWTGRRHPNATKLQDDDPGCGSGEAGSPGCLFDIDKDPTEHVDLAAGRPELLHNLSRKLAAAAATSYQTGDDGFHGEYTNCTTLKRFVEAWPGFGGPLCYAGDVSVALRTRHPGAAASRPPCNADTSCDLDSADKWRCGHDASLPPSADNNCHLAGPVTAGNSTCSCGAAACESSPAAPTSPRKLQYLMIGDSVSMGAQPLVFGNLSSHGIEGTHSPGNAASSNLGAHCLDRWTRASARRWDLISFQFGLHDLAFDTERLGVAQYTALLANITARLVALQRRDATQLLWVTTTPVPTVPTYSAAGPCNVTSACLNPPRFDADVQLYNAAAAQVVAAANAAGATIDTLDLYSLVLARCGGPGYKSCEGFQLPANVHYTHDGWQALADATVAKVVWMLAREGRAGTELVEQSGVAFI